MTFQSINLGSAPNDGTGDDLRAAGGKINANFGTLFQRVDLATRETAGLMSAADKAKLDAALTGIDLATVEAAGLMSPSDKVRLENALTEVALATPQNPGLMSPEDKVRLDAALTEVALATAKAAGLMSANDKEKLNGIAPEATKNAADAHLLARANHTGTQAIDTINGLGAALDGKAAVVHEHVEATPSAAGFLSGADKTKLNGIAAQATANATDAQLRDRTTHTGVQAISTVTGLQAALDGKAATSHSHSDATPTAAGFMSAADKAKLNGIATGATINAADAQLRDRSTHTGAQAISTVTGLQAALDGKAATSHSHSDATPTTAGFMSAADKAKLNGIAAGATINAPDAQLRDRSTHTGTQAIGTVAGLQAALDGKAGTALATTTTSGLMSAADKVRLNNALTEITGEILTTKAIPVAADQVVVFDSREDYIPKLVPAGAFAPALLTRNLRTGSTYTLAAEDQGCGVTMSHSAANTVIIPAGEALPVGAVISVVQTGAGTTTVAAAAGVTLNGLLAGSLAIAARWQAVSLWKVGANEWIASGAFA